MDSKNNYHINEVCELRELIYCKEKFKNGITFNQFKTISKKEGIPFKESYKNENVFVVYAVDILEKCKRSGRQYCGINFKFENNKLVIIEPGYPCH